MSERKVGASPVLGAPYDKEPKAHNWSGWPGAWCFNCGQECKAELEFAGLSPDELKHLTDECPEPGSNRFNPYVKKEEQNGQ